MIFAEAYKWPDSYLRASVYFNQRFIVLDSIFSSSDYCACSLKKVLRRDDHVSTIYIGVDTAVFRPVSASELMNRLNIPTDSKVVLALSRMNEEMGYDIVLKAAKELLATNDNLYFVMAGATGQYTDKVLEFCANHDRAVCQINVPINDKVFYYAMADIFLAPTEQTHACMGVSIKEAMACGTAIVASRSGGIPEAIKHRENGCLVGFEQKKAEVDALIYETQFLLDHEEVATELAKQARVDAERTFSTAAMLKKYDDLLNSQ
jgi:starch synthase